MIIFKRIRYKNFLSAGNTETEIQLDGPARTLIVGTNGAGKSLILDALSFGLFGKSHRKINKNQLINSINGKNLVVTVEFEIGEQRYKIVRGIKPNIFEIYVNDELINQESHARDYQNILETNILKLNHKTFHQVVVLGSSNFIPFMQLNSFQRREIIEEILDISIFSKMNALLKEEAAKLKDTLRDIEYDHKICGEKIKLQHIHINKLKDIADTNSNKIDEEISELRTQIETLCSQNDQLLHTYASEYPKVSAARDELRSQLDKMIGYEHNIQANIRAASEEQNFYVAHDSCPACSQSIHEDLKSEKLHSCKTKLTELSDGYNRIQKNIASLKSKCRSYEAELQKLLAHNTKVAANQTLISNYERKIQDLYAHKQKEDSCGEAAAATKELNSLLNTFSSLSEQKSVATEERSYTDAILELLKDTGIKTKIIRQYLPAMNKLINSYLKTLDFFVSFELDENFNETIRSRYRDDFSYSSFSEGEKSRIDLSIMFAWRQIAKLKNSTNTNLLILDEVFDSSLDTDGIDNLVKIMNTLDAETRFYVITHKPDSFENLFDRRITASRQGNFTSYHVEDLKP